MRVGLVCPYSLEVPGGVQAHVVNLAAALRALGHEVSVLAPAGRAVPVPYNGSVARLGFGPRSYRQVRRWLSEHEFDVLHLHEPTAPSVSLLALTLARGPVVATFHTSIARSRGLLAVRPVLRPLMERVTARIAVSDSARRVQVEHLGGDAVEIPNGVDVDFHARAEPLPGYPRAGGTIGFVGRYDEPRKGMPVLLAALPLLAKRFPDLRVLVVGHGDADRLRAADRRITVLGPVEDQVKASVLRSVDVLCAPNIGAESFGMVLTEAMSAGTPLVASDLDAFRRVLDGGRAGVLVPPGDPAGLAAGLTAVLDDPALRERLAGAGRLRATAFDWPSVAQQVLRVYETASAAHPRVLA
ncbi:glycosyltransferase family 4 protein [Kutzneria viridogrisea]|uniref:GDP-mannose-dependent alpha-(1-2)-phosphatidylinositol mannosyltransferase n=2 Tax=Kutzneria TaxID=43356 RepID=W5WC84_9PSEU|nr:glycosyltransferase family 4 protein [Kutzneria albida]AHH95819.1 GDP-mannose-dependent alpha-(1-2)-phosphatidylinositol mannosyltransferase [Kutzneria albida DSM 43870]MBA8926661.1 phosphatidylinositol alpha-mannosyltransferase [Kutzneria viridogrisea]